MIIIVIDNVLSIILNDILIECKKLSMNIILNNLCFSEINKFL